MKKSELEKYLNDYKEEYKRVNGKPLSEDIQEYQNPEDPSDEENCLDFDYDAVDEDGCPLD